MARTRKYRSKKKKTGRRRRRRQQLKVGFPMKYRTKLRYTDTIFLNCGENGTVQHVFHCNNIWDPDVSGTGHQPRHHDLFAEIYDNYTVTKAKMSVKIVGFSNTTDDAQAIGIRASPDNTLEIPNVSIAALHEMGRTAATTWTMVKAHEPLATRTITKTWSQARMKTIGGVNNDDVYMGQTDGSGPSKRDFFIIFATSSGLGIVGDDPPSLRLLVNVDYDVTYTGMKGNLPQD